MHAKHWNVHALRCVSGCAYIDNVSIYKCDRSSATWHVPMQLTTVLRWIALMRWHVILWWLTIIWWLAIGRCLAILQRHVVMGWVVMVWQFVIRWWLTIMCGSSPNDDLSACIHDELIIRRLVTIVRWHVIMWRFAAMYWVATMWSYWFVILHNMPSMTCHDVTMRWPVIVWWFAIIQWLTIHHVATCHHAMICHDAGAPELGSTVQNTPPTN